MCPLMIDQMQLSVVEDVLLWSCPCVYWLHTEDGPYEIYMRYT